MKEKPVHSRYHRTTPTERTQWVQRFHQSDLSQRDFALRHGLGLSTLAKWLQKENRTERIGWQEVTLPAMPSAPVYAWAAEIAFQDGSTLRLDAARAATLLEPWLATRS